MPNSVPFGNVCVEEDDSVAYVPSTCYQSRIVKEMPYPIPHIFTVWKVRLGDL